MAKLHLRHAKPSQGLGILAQHLVSLGHELTTVDEAQGTICWGMSTQKGPSINGNVNRYDKLTAFEAFRAVGIACPVTFSVDDGFTHCFHSYKHLPELPWLARKVHHTKGRDIRVCRTREGVLGTSYNKRHDFFSVFIPTKTEYRAWVWRKRLLTAHEKVWKGQGEFQGYIRNHRFGFQFQKREELREDPRFVEPCVNAVKALELDFGAVDLLEGKDGKLYVLEVNTTPAIDSVERSTGIRLARAISRWAEDKL